MSLGFGLLITLIGVVSVFSVLAMVALVCVVLKRLFKREIAGKTDVPLSKEPRLKAEEKVETRPHALAFRIKLNGEEHDVKIEDLGTLGKEFEEVMPSADIGEELKVVVSDVEYKVKVEEIEKVKVTYPTAVKEAVQTVEEAVEDVKKVITAPMQGTVVNVPVKLGDNVEKGSVVVVLETMKMENAIESTVSGTIKKIRVSEGDSVKDGDTLVIIG